MAIVENIQRQDLNVIEEAEGYRTLADLFNMTQQDVADRVGKARASVANAVRLLELPDEVKQLIGNGLLSSGHAKVLRRNAQASRIYRRSISATSLICSTNTLELQSGYHQA
jgi:ParB family chromosome partitioning protein